MLSFWIQSPSLPCLISKTYSRILFIFDSQYFVCLHAVFLESHSVLSLPSDYKLLEYRDWVLLHYFLSFTISSMIMKISWQWTWKKVKFYFYLLYAWWWQKVINYKIANWILRDFFIFNLSAMYCEHCPLVPTR